jgi:hypothetical protein
MRWWWHDDDDALNIHYIYIICKPHFYGETRALPGNWKLENFPFNVQVLISVSFIQDSSSTPGVFYTNFYNHARRLRLKKLLYIELSRSSNGYFKPLLDPGGGFTSETAARRF